MCELESGMRQNESHAGTLKCQKDVLSYQSGSHSWSVGVSDIVLVGEYTTSDGPLADDYFLVFFTAQQSEGWHQASFYAEGRDEALATLAEIFGRPLQLGLCNSANFKSQIIWPHSVAEKVLFDLIPHSKILGRFRQKWLGASVEFVLSDAAISILKR